MLDQTITQTEKPKSGNHTQQQQQQQRGQCQGHETATVEGGVSTKRITIKIFRSLTL